uniref:Anaphase-promoting complex subunit cdc20 n=3 Tax=Lygus hesperus TaxID=30085 RepID=A0A0A9Z0H0_LYGHE
MDDGTHIALGTSENDVQLWNIESKKQIRTMKGHTSRVSCLAWNTHILTSGSRDTSIFHHDVRIAQHHFATLSGHELEVCNVRWNLQGTQLASGSNDNTCLVWDLKNYSQPVLRLTDSCAAVKALDWCPWQDSVLATGGGTADRHIRFYNVASNSLIRSIDTQSQVCSLLWSKTEKEILSSHGFAQNQLSIWRYPSLSKITDLNGHTSRVLYTALSPDGTTIASASGDETLRFWNVWTSLAEKQARKELQAQYDHHHRSNSHITTSSSTTKLIPSSSLQLRLR